MKNVMVDIETLGTGCDAVILSIGAVEFDETGVGDVFSVQVNPVTCQNRGMSIDVNTVMWWLNQSEDARKALTVNQVPISDALLSLSDFISKCDPKPLVWGNGATFDNVILANAYRLCNITKPWDFRSDRCFRTLKAMFPNVPINVPDGVSHCALDDALWQARVASNLLYILKSSQATYGAQV